jgi:entericidin A
MTVYSENRVMLRKVILIAAVGASALVLTACNTVKGLGRDIESVGEAGDEMT